MISWRLKVFDELASTSDACLAAAQEGEAEGLAILALRQTAGRGSRGRSWVAPAGNLNLSVLLRPGCPARRMGMYALAAGVAVADALAEAGAPPVRLKWPNDVLADGAKLAGILIDAAPQGDRLDWVVIGIGINLATAPVVAGRRTTALAEHGLGIDPVKMAALLLPHLAVWTNAADAALREAWLARAHPLQTPLTVQGGQKTLTGYFSGLSDRGELLLESGGQVKTIRTGNVLLGQAWDHEDDFGD